MSEVDDAMALAYEYRGERDDLAARLAAAEAREARVRALLDDPSLMPYIRRKIRAALGG